MSRPGLTKRQKRMVAVAALVTGVSLAAALGVTAFRKNMMYFYTPSDLLSGTLPAGAALQLGGLVERGSLKHGEGLKIEFVMSDCKNAVPVRYDGVLPDLFREGQGVVATGHMEAGQVFVASTILAKHDENYMPPNVAKAVGNVDGKHSCAPFKSVTAPS
ncbi:MAG: cytochrome c maturation protein CcmE [Nevskia sp.]|nr:cytochrome c maturation protein CcmE [Nevskia sp.]